MAIVLTKMIANHMIVLVADVHFITQLWSDPLNKEDTETKKSLFPNLPYVKCLI